MKINSGESISLTRPYKNQHHAIWKLLYVHTNMLYLQKSTSKIDWLFFINYCTWLHFILPQKYYVDVDQSLVVKFRFIDAVSLHNSATMWTACVARKSGNSLWSIMQLSLMNQRNSIFIIKNVVAVTLYRSVWKWAWNYIYCSKRFIRKVISKMIGIGLTCLIFIVN